MKTKIKFLKKSKKRILLCINNIKSGLANDIGNTFRRILLSSISGYAVTYVKIEGFTHQYDYIDGVSEDITEIILNIKDVVFKLRNCNRIFLKVNKKGPSYLKAKDFYIKNFCKTLNNNFKICKINMGYKLSICIEIRKGCGYINGMESFNSFNKINKQDKIYIDNSFSPILNVNYNVVDKKFHEKLIIDIETNGSVSSKRAFFESCEIYLRQFLFLKKNKERIKKIDRKGILVNNFLYEKLEFLCLKKKTLIFLKKLSLLYVYDLFNLNKSKLTLKSIIKKKYLSDIKRKINKVGFFL